MNRTCCLSLASVALVLVGCVERRITVKSEPPGARISVDGHPLADTEGEPALTPHTFNFTFYGEREIALEKEGFQRHRHVEKIRAPVYQWFPIDLFTELLLPVRIVDSREYHYDMAKWTPPVREDVVKRAEAFRNLARLEELEKEKSDTDLREPRQPKTP